MERAREKKRNDRYINFPSFLMLAFSLIFLRASMRTYWFLAHIPHTHTHVLEGGGDVRGGGRTSVCVHLGYVPFLAADGKERFLFRKKIPFVVHKKNLLWLCFLKKEREAAALSKSLENCAVIKMNIGGFRQVGASERSVQRQATHLLNNRCFLFEIWAPFMNKKQALHLNIQKSVELDKLQN
jgi:hypothetical protein